MDRTPDRTAFLADTEVAAGLGTLRNEHIPMCRLGAAPPRQPVLPDSLWLRRTFWKVSRQQCDASVRQRFSFHWAKTSTRPSLPSGQTRTVPVSPGGGGVGGLGSHTLLRGHRAPRGEGSTEGRVAEGPLVGARPFLSGSEEAGDAAWLRGGAREPPSCRAAGSGCRPAPPPAAAHCVLGHAVAAESVPTGKKMCHVGLIIPVLRCRFY